MQFGHSWAQVSRKEYMARKKKSIELVEKVPPTYISYTAALSNAASAANEMDSKGYDIAYCFAVVANGAQEGEPEKPVQGIYLLGKKRS
jgi:hypothetical protein